MTVQLQRLRERYGDTWFNSGASETLNTILINSDDVKESESQKRHPQSFPTFPRTKAQYSRRMRTVQL